MRILYEIVGEGMGHATRSRVVIEYLLVRGHEVRVVVSGRAFRYLHDLLQGRERIQVTEIEGLHLVAKNNTIDRARTLRENLSRLPAALLRNVPVFRDVVRHFSPECVISDFDTFSYLLGRTARVPVIGLDNIQFVARCNHDEELLGADKTSFKLARAATAMRLPDAYHYIVPSFVSPPLRKGRTTLIPPILRPEILWAVRRPGEHVLVYQTDAGDDAFIAEISRLPYEFRVYGTGRVGSIGSAHFRTFSEKEFVDDLRTARAVVASGGFSLICEALHLRVPTLSVPLRGQFEQELNARYLEALGYGAWTPQLDAATLVDFLGRTSEFEAVLAKRERTGNAVLYSCVDQLLDLIGRGAPPPADLTAEGGFGVA